MVYQNGKAVAMSLASSSKTSENVFSEEETKIGLFSNGKPVYRKCISGIPISGFINNSKDIVEFIRFANYGKSALKIDNLLSLRGTLSVKNEELDYVFPYTNLYQGTVYYINPIITQSSFDIARFGGPIPVSILQNGTINVILEYTKTTDVGTTVSVTMNSVAIEAKGSDAKTM